MQGRRGAGGDVHQQRHDGRAAPLQRHHRRGAGLNSHAAIVGLTLNKPVIVGAAGALRKLHDGQDISVDSERGVINAMLK